MFPTAYSTHFHILPTNLELLITEQHRYGNVTINIQLVMRRTTLFICISLVFGIAFFSGFIWFNWNLSQLNRIPREGGRSHLRLAYDFQSPQTVDEYYANTQRFSVVIVTHKEALLKKTYPMKRAISLVYS